MYPAFLDAFRRDGHFLQLESSGLHSNLLAVLELRRRNADRLEPMEAIKQTARDRGVPKNEIYSRMVTEKEN